jgi:hypothetical protein
MFFMVMNEACRNGHSILALFGFLEISIFSMLDWDSLFPAAGRSATGG